jgi:prolyl 4-hydroxylase
MAALTLLLLTSTAPTATSAIKFFGQSTATAESDAVESNTPEAVTHTPQKGQELNAFGEPTYGVDVSFPIHRTKISENYASLPHNTDPDHNPTPPQYDGMPIQYLGNKQAEYDELMAGCNAKYNKRHSSYSACQSTEDDRVEMSLRQPASMQNYTDIGFKKIKAPPAVWDNVKKFWEENKDRKNWKDENWPVGNTYTNHWKAPTYMVSVEDGQLRGAGSRLKNRIWDAAQSTIEEWTGQELTKCSLYGIRVYTEGSILATHVDRMPLVSSAIINVDQDVDEPWPIEVYGHDGKAYNVTMEPGDMVLYESHSVLHGRPFPLKGRYYANIFVHFEPVGHSLRHNAKEAAERAAAGHKDDHETGGHEQEESDGLPPYITRGSVEDKRWRATHRGAASRNKRKDTFTTGSTPAHKAAQSGDAEALKNVIDELGHLIDAKDANGWTPLHEGARAGHVEVVQLLVDKGANINERTQNGIGGTPLYWSIENNGEDHPVSELLASLGGISIGPDL